MHDDFSLPPIAPPIDPEIIEQEAELQQEDVRLADAYFHPSWAKVQDILNEVIEASRYGSANANLPADEYKIEDLVNKRVAAQLQDLLVRIQNAVESVETIKRAKGDQ